MKILPFPHGYISNFELKYQQWKPDNTCDWIANFYKVILNSYWLILSMFFSLLFLPPQSWVGHKVNLIMNASIHCIYMYVCVCLPIWAKLLGNIFKVYFYVNIFLFFNFIEFLKIKTIMQYAAHRANKFDMQMTFQSMHVQMYL